MKNKIHALKATTLSAVAITSITAVATLSTSVQAAPWKTLPGSSCVPHNPGKLVSNQIRRDSSFIMHTDTGGHTSTSVYCPITMDHNSPQTIGVWVDYSKLDSLSCALYTNHWKGIPKISKAFIIPSGSRKASYKTINTGAWWSVQVLCSLGNGDQIHALNYSAL